MSVFNLPGYPILIEAIQYFISVKYSDNTEDVFRISDGRKIGGGKTYL